MPKNDRLRRFVRDFERLSPDNADLFKAVILKVFVPALRVGLPYPPELRIKPIQGKPGIWEMAWANNGRATFSFGPKGTEGDPHIIWRRVGTHDVFRNP